MSGVTADENQTEAAAKQQVGIKPSVVKKLLELHWTKDKAADGAKINPDAVTLAAEYLNMFVVEAHLRAQLEAELDSDEMEGGVLMCGRLLSEAHALHLSGPGYSAFMKF